ncbi:S8 family peptidase [Virgibacillus sp. YIM 98842]|uniref:S8 family peptidase n=1 Tax=Virgibacillus sp. YIM 98842 TaxID=2663533 RepID=UPI0013DA0CF9|nr:S8 family peptidase [Virgibacillus sp. YIM 98842]
MKWKTVVGAGVLTLILSLIVGFTLSDSFQTTAIEDSSASQAAGESYTVTLITGDQVTVHEHENGKQEVNIEPAERDGYEANFEKMEVDGEDLYIIPDDVLQYIPDKLDRELFNITRLIDQEYDDANSDNIPIIITMEDRAVNQSMRSMDTSLSETSNLPSINGVAAEVSKEETESLHKALFTTSSENTLQSTSLFSNIDKIHLDQKVEVELEDSVPQIGAPEAWDAGYDGTGMTVAVLDSGIDANHPDLEGKVVAEENFSSDETTDDLHGHGTHVAATVAGSGDASDGLRQGVAPGADLINAKVLNSAGSGAISDIIEGMEWAAQEGASILNMSLGGGVTDGTDPMSLAVNSISEEYNVLFVISAGNSGPGNESVTTPGAADDALTVAAFDKEGELASFSSRGPRTGDYAITPHIAAPGVAIQAARAEGTSMGTPIDDYYTAANGTSMAAPHVAGVAALYAQKQQEAGDFNAELVKSALVSTAGPNDEYTVFEQGGGLINAERALTQDVFAQTATLDMGFFEYPHEDLEPVTDTIVYQNAADEDVTLEFSVDVQAPDEFTLPEDMIEISDEEITVEAGETAELEVTVNPSLGELGLYGGYITASSADDETLIHTPLGFYKEPESYDLTIEGITRNDQVPLGPSRVSVMNAIDSTVFSDYNVTFTEQDEGEITFRVEAGTYNINSMLYTYESADDPTVTSEVAMINEPMVEVYEDTKITLDGSDAFPVTAEVEDEAELDSFSLAYHRSAEELGSITSSYSFIGGADFDVFAYTPTEPISLGEFGFYTQWEFLSPDAYYNLVLEDAIVSDTHYDIANDELAQFDTKYYAQQPGDTYSRFQHKWRPYEFASFAASKRMDLPQERMEYFVGDDTRYRSTIAPSDEWPGGVELRHDITEFEVGLHERNWYKQAMQPGIIPGSSPVYREDGNLEVFLYEYTDADGHYSTGAPDANPVFRVYENEELVEETDRPRGTFPLDSDSSEIRLELEMDADKAWSPYSSYTLTNWTFNVEEPEAEEQETAPILFIDYDLNLNMNNAAVRDDEHNLNFAVNHQAGAEPAAIEDAVVSISYDDGENWTELQDAAHLGDGSFNAVLNHDNVPESNGFVSLKIEAWDTDGNSIEQEIIRAYRIPVTADSMITHIERFENEGEMENETSARQLKTHLTAVDQYENRGEAAKVIRHMESFDQLLDYQLDQGLISEKAYHFLKADSDTITGYWE